MTVIEDSDTLTSKERGSFIGGAIVESFFFFISIVGYVMHVFILTPTLTGVACFSSM
jgi:hypothetical protein